jgi:hypothetical protein
MPSSKWQPRPLPVEIQMVKSPGVGSGSLLEDVRQFRITPAQAVARFFDNGKPNNASGQFWRTLREVLELLPRCDWENDPNVKQVDDDPSLRWVEMDPENKNQVSMVFTSESAVIEHGIKPLLGHAFDFKAWVEQLTHGQLVDPEGDLERRATQAEDAEAHAEAALSGQLELRPSAGAPPMDERTNGDNITIRDTGKGTSAAYLAARLKKAGRDDLLEQIGPGKPHRSVRSAAIEAGIIKPVPTIRLVNDLTVVAAKLCQHLTREQRIELIDLLAPEL